MLDFQDEGGEPLEVRREDLVRVWGWWPGGGGYKISTTLVLKDCVEELIEQKRAEGWHVWATKPLLIRMD